MSDSGRQIGDCPHARTPEACVDCLQEEVAKLQAFKNWTHQYLDAHGVPHHPPGTHGAEGCRIGDRMDWLMAELAKAKEAAS